MTVRFKALVCVIAFLIALPAHAQDKPPVPKEAPPRVPFSAFRMKPILDPQLSKTLVAPDHDAPFVPKKPMKKIVPDKNALKIESIPKNDVLQAPPPVINTLPGAVVLQAPKPSMPPVRPLTAPADAVRAKAPGGVAVPVVPLALPPREDDDVYESAVAYANGLPVPPRKPGSQSNIRFERASPSFDQLARTSVTEAPVSEAPIVVEAPAALDVPVPPMDPELELAMIPKPQPVPQEVELAPGQSQPNVRIRDEDREVNRNRFSSQDRMAGSSGGFGDRLSRVFTRSPSREAKAMRVGPLREGDGVSPVLLPGLDVTVAAPDYQPVSQSGVPNDVIVFFQENSAEMEVGQMDVLNHDVVEQMQSNPSLEVEIIGYAEPQAGGDGVTDKMSLSRALMVRSYLTRQRIDDDRLTVTAKGDDTKVEPRDRVEMTFSQ